MTVVLRRSTLLASCLSLLCGVLTEPSLAAPTAGGSTARGSKAGGVFVEPLEIKAQLAPGATASYPIQLQSHLPQPIKIAIVANDAVQQGNGVPEFFEAGEHPASCGTWLSLGEGPKQLETGQGGTVQVKVTVPKGARGDRLCTVMVEITPTTGPGGTGGTSALTSLVLRYAVLVRVSLEGAAPQAKVGLRQAGWAEEEVPTIQADVTNLSEATTPVQAEAVVLDAEGKRIVERLRLESPKANQSVTTQAVYPGGYVTFAGAVKRGLPAGTYQTRLIVRYGQNRTLVSTLPLTVTATQAAAKTGADRVAWEGDPVDVTLAPGGRRTVMLAVRNPTEQPARVALRLEPRGKLCEGWVVDLPPAIEIPPRMRMGVAVTLQAGSGVTTQCVGALTGDVAEQPPLVGLPLQAATSVMKPQAEVTALHQAKGQLTVTVKNTGPLALRPTVLASVTVPGQAEPVTVPLLAAQGGMTPGEEQQFAGTVPAELTPGVYKVAATIQNEGKRPFTLASPTVDLKMP